MKKLLLELFADEFMEGDMFNYAPEDLVEAIRAKAILVCPCKRPFYNIKLSRAGVRLVKEIKNETS